VKQSSEQLLGVGQGGPNRVRPDEKLAYLAVLSRYDSATSVKVNLDKQLRIDRNVKS
jgi:hypothetical protein